MTDLTAKALNTGDPERIAASPSLQASLGGEKDTLPWAQLLDLCAQIDGAPRHLGLHNGGMVVTGAPITERVPTEPAAMPGRVVCQWDKDALEAAGLVKIDLLGLRMLSAVAEAVEIVAATTGVRPDLDALAFDDPEVYALIARMVHPYLRRRLGREPVTVPHPSLEGALRETLGVILFQEQVLKVARDLAGFTPGQGEVLRRALGSKRERGPFVDLADLRRRTGLPRAAVETLVMAGALDGWGVPRRKLLWELGELRDEEDALDLAFAGDGVALPALSEAEELSWERATLGLSTGAHPMALYREGLKARGVLSSAEVKARKAGLKLLRA